MPPILIAKNKMEDGDSVTAGLKYIFIFRIMLRELTFCWFHAFGRSCVYGKFFLFMLLALLARATARETARVATCGRAL